MAESALIILKAPFAILPWFPRRPPLFHSHLHLHVYCTYLPRICLVY